MSQADFNIANVSRSLFRQETNESLQALASLSSGATAPATTYSYMWWADTATGILKQRNAANDGWINKGNIADVNWGFAALAVLQTFTASQRGTVTTDNDGSFDMNVTNNFKCTPTGTFTLTFTNITAGQSGYVLLVNSGGYAISAASTTKVGASLLSTISTAGTYLLSYMSDGTNVYVTSSGALS
jgi:hypothetical protein